MVELKNCFEKTNDNNVIIEYRTFIWHISLNKNSKA